MTNCELNLKGIENGILRNTSSARTAAFSLKNTHENLRTCEHTVSRRNASCRRLRRIDSIYTGAVAAERHYFYRIFIYGENRRNTDNVFRRN